MSDILLDAAYLAAAILFVLGLRGLNSPQTARRGILLAEIGMLLAVVGTLLRSEIIRLWSEKDARSAAEQLLDGSSEKGCIYGPRNRANTEHPQRRQT